MDVALKICSSAVPRMKCRAARIVWCQSAILQCCAAGGVPLDVLRAAVAKAAKKLPTQLEAVKSALKQVNAQLQASCLILHPRICAEGLCRPAVKGRKFPALNITVNACCFKVGLRACASSPACGRHRLTPQPSVNHCQMPAVHCRHKKVFSL